MRNISADSGVCIRLSIPLLATHVYTPSCNLLIVFCIVSDDINISRPELLVITVLVILNWSLLDNSESNELL